MIEEMLLDEKELMKRMDLSLQSHLQKVKEIFEKILNENNKKYNKECVKISENRKTLFVSSLGNVKETLIKFNSDKVVFTSNDIVGVVKIENLKLNKQTTDNIKESTLFAMDGKQEFFELSNRRVTSESFDELSFRNALIKLIYVFVNLNIYKYMDKKTSESPY